MPRESRHLCHSRSRWLVTLLSIFNLWAGLLSPTHAQEEAATAVSTVPIRETARLGAAGEKFLVYGTVTAEVAPGHLFLQDASGGVRIRLMHPMALKPGDELRVLISGFDPNGAWFISYSAERIGERPLPVPDFVRASDANALDHNSAYLTVRGVVQSIAPIQSQFIVEGKPVTIPFDMLITQCDGVPVRILFRATDHAPALFPVGTEAEFSGVCRLSFDPSLTEARQMELTVANPAMVRVLQRAPSPPPPPDLRWVYWTLGSVGLLGSAAAAWVFVRAQRARAAKRRLLALNAELESRVAERTAELVATNESLRRSEEQLAHALERQTELVQLKTNFVSLVSHEFRTPLEVITSSAFNLERYHDRLTPERRGQLLVTIKKAVQRMAGMMEQVLFLGRLEPGRVEFNPQPLDLSALVQRCREEILAATNQRCTIDLHLSGDLIGAMGDESVLHHVFSNLLSNAVKYSPAQGTVRFLISREGNDARCSVSDEGCGIPEADQSRLFEAFHRASNVGNTPGTGLGLVIVRRCLEIHGGRIAFQSQIGRGTTFIVHLPLFASRPSL